MDALKDWLTGYGLTADHAAVIAALAATLAALILSLIAFFIAKRLLARAVQVAARRTRGRWDDAFVEAGVFTRLSHMVPGVIVDMAAPIAYGDFPGMESAVHTGVSVYLALAGLMVVDGILSAGLQIYGHFEIARRVAIKPLVQVLKIVIFCTVGAAVVALLLGKSPLIFFSGVGAFSAVVMLVFKDPILGFVAGIQLMANNMVRPGDWIEMAKYGADGDVIDVSLTTVKVTELGQDDQHHPDLCAGIRFLPQLAGHVGVRGAADQTVREHRRDQHQVLRPGDAGAFPAHPVHQRVRREEDGGAPEIQPGQGF